MSSILQYGYPEVPKSITNPNVSEKDAIDTGSAMSFLEFIKIIKISFEPDIIQTYYNEYLKRWNLKTKAVQTDENAAIVTKYKEFIQEINLKYTTIEERDFLNKIDFNDKHDLDTVLGFYSKKLIEISNYYNSKRDDVKFDITRKKLKGSVVGLEKTILEKTIEYLENKSDGQMQYDIDLIKEKIKVDISELYNTYGLYFDQTPDVKVYDYKDLDFGENIFLKTNPELISTVFAGVSDNIKQLKEADTLFDNKRKLTEKSVSSNFYFLSTGSTTSQFVSGLLFEANNTSRSILNRNYPTTASTLKGKLIDKYEIGFFKHSKSSIVFIDGKNQSFSYNLDVLEPNTIYYFPDPFVFGGNGGVISFYADDDFLKRNFSSGNAVNQPNSSKNDTKYYGYVTEKTTEFDQNFEEIFDSGYISDQKSDLYGNQYGLFKIDDNFESGIAVSEENKTIKSLILNGYKFYDDLFGEGYSFNYYATSPNPYTETIRSGLSSHTNSFSALSSPWYLFFRYYTPYQELKQQTEFTFEYSLANKSLIYAIRDCGTFFKNDFEPLEASINSDLYAFPGSGTYYFESLYEAGLNSTVGPQRALLDPLYPSLTANFDQSLRPTASNDVIGVDGGNFTTNFEFDYKIDQAGYTYIDETNKPSQYSLESFGKTNYNDRIDLNGQLFVKNNTKKTSRLFVDEFSYIDTKYNASVYSQLSTITKFELLYDTLIIETPNYLVFEKIKIENGEFVNPKTIVYEIEHDTNDIDKISNRFKVDNYAYYCVLKTNTYPISSNNYIIYPEIYKYDTFNNINTKIFPINDSDFSNTAFFSISGNNVRYVRAEAPTFTYNSRNDIFNISFLLKDQNDMIALHEYDFIAKPNVSFLSHNAYVGSFENYSNIFTTNYDTLLSVYLSAGSTSISNEEFML